MTTSVPRVFVDEEGQVFVSPNADFLPERPPVRRTITSIFEGLKLGWGFDQYFYTAFTPTETHYRGPIFGCLCWEAVSIQKVKTYDGYGYRLHPSLLKEWSALEDIVMAVQTVVLKRLIERILLPMDMCMTPAPSQIPYWRVFPSHKNARQTASAVRASFTIRLAFMAYTVMMVEAMEKKDFWTTAASEEDIPQTICDAFCSCKITDWSVMRVGVFVDAAKIHAPDTADTWVSNIPRILALGKCVPIWLYYGSDGRLAEKQAQHAVTKRYLPPRNMVLQAIEESQASRLQPHNDTILETIVDPSSTVTAPIETFDQYMLRERPRQLDVEKSESVLAARARKERERQQETQPVPSRGGPLVYRWTTDGGYPNRHLVEQRHVARLWESTSASQRHYNSFKHEYDVIEEYHAGENQDNERAVSPDDERIEPENTHMYDPFANAAIFPKAAELSTHHTSVPIASSFHQIMADALYPYNDDRIEVDSLAMVLQIRYGVLSSKPDYEVQMPMARSWMQHPVPLYRILGHWSKRDGLTAHNAELLPSTADFVAHVLEGQDPPLGTCDLRGSSITSPQNLPSPFTLTSFKATTTTWYKLAVDNDKQTDGNWDVFTTSALTVNHIRRGSFATTKSALVTNLVARGITFRTMRPSTVTERAVVEAEPLGHDLLDNFPVGLGVKAYKTVLTKEDYAAYEEIRDDILLQQRRGRAALCKGGILWRVAREAVSIDTVQTGPLGDGAMFTVTLGGQTYEDDDLTPQEISQILGVYRVQTAQSERTASKSSWWPTCETWVDSGMSISYWSDQNEDWFQRRLAEVRTGRASVKPADQWKRELKFSRLQSRTFITNAEKLASQCI